jgi:predicted ester cyclase
MSTPEQNKSAVLKFFSTLGKAEHASLSKSYLHKEHKFHFPLFPDTLDTEGHKKLDLGFLEGFPDAKVIIDDIFSSDNKVVLRGKFTGTHTGEFNGIPPTGKKVSLPFIDILLFKDGKNIEEWVEMDTIKMMKQLELVAEQY